jgi:hypothetical protein
VVGAAVLLGDDVFDVKCLELVVVLVEPAILATMAGPFPNELSERLVYHSSWVAARS